MNTPWVQSCSTQWGDFSNSLGQSPCSVALALGQVCNPSWTLYPLPPSAKRSGYYPGPAEEDATPCRCSTVLYSLLSACGLCQDYDKFISWSQYSKNCSKVFLSKFPEGIPSKYSIPGWAYLDVTSSGRFDPPKAGSFKGPESLGPGIQPTTTGVSPPFTASPKKSGLGSGAIIGVIVFLVFAVLVAGLLIRWIRRRARYRPSTYDDDPHPQRHRSLHPLDHIPGHLKPLCVVCKSQFTYHNNATCGIECTKVLWENGGNPAMCDYCHRQPKRLGYGQCGAICEEKAYVACLLCRARPKGGVNDLCGEACKEIAMKSAPLLETPQYHETYAMVETNFQQAWHNVPGHGPCPPVRRVYRIIEDEDDLRQPYLIYKQSFGNEQFRYHGTVRRSQCKLGISTTAPCGSPRCPLCNILESSFKVSLAKTTGAATTPILNDAELFGPGVYTSSASNKAYTYTKNGNGALILAKVVLGRVKTVSDWEEVKFCPPGYNSVAFDRMSGKLNETIVYTDDAIRPVFLIFF